MLDSIGSYIVGGIALVMMAVIILNLQEDARDTMMNEISQLSLAEMSQTMEREMTNMGYRAGDAQKIVRMSYREITFLSDYDNNGVVDTISYTMNRTRSGPEVTRSIRRPGRAPMNWTTRGSMVIFTGYDQNGNPTTNAALVRAVEASMLTSNVLYDKLAAYESNSVGSTSGSSSTGVSGTVQSTDMLTNHATLLTTAVDCKAGAYWHKTIYPKNLTLVAPQLAGVTEENTGTGQSSGTTNPGTTDPGTTNPGTTDPGTTDPGTTDPGTGGTVTPPDNGSTNPVIVPPSNKNSPCPCGSGLKYKDCHGK